MSQNPILPKIEGYVRELFKKRSAAENIYHNIIHTSEVVNVASRIAHEEELSDQDTEIVLIAAWFMIPDISIAAMVMKIKVQNMPETI